MFYPLNLWVNNKNVFVFQIKDCALLFQGNNAVVIYSIETIQSVFQINENSGEILVANSEKLDREVNETFILNVSVKTIKYHK